MHDVGNLCWKLTAVLNGQADPSLLDSYEAERRPSDGNNVRCAVANAMNHFTIDQALALSPEKSAEENWAELRPLWEDLPNSEEKRVAVNAAIASQSMEFRHHNTEYGYTYTSSAVIEDGSAPYVPLDQVRLYVPSTKPGHPSPHAWVERMGQRIPLNTLTYGGKFLLIAGEEGADWIDAAKAVADEVGVEIEAVRVGILEGDNIDVRCAWTKTREISEQGAVLVRPDRFVGFRSIEAANDAKATLRGAMGAMLGR